MTQVSKYKVDKEVYDEIYESFLQVLSDLKTSNEVDLFLSEFLTPNEKVMFSKRLAIGLLISQDVDYKNIISILKVSSATVGVFSSHYKYNTEYRKVIDKIIKTKRMNNLLLSVEEFVTKIGTYGRKGAHSWKVINKSISNKKSKILQ